MINDLLSQRIWSKTFCLYPRKCYLSGNSLLFTMSYRGRKKIWSFIENGKYINDDMWLCKHEYDRLIKQGD